VKLQDPALQAWQRYAHYFSWAYFSADSQGYSLLHTAVVKNCEEFACGAVIAAAETGCAWWEVTSKVFRTEDGNPTPTQLGSLTTYAKGSAKKAQTTIFLVSSEPILPEVYLSQIRVICHRSSSDAPKPGHTYLANPAPSPTTSS